MPLIELDAIDLRILSALQSDGRLTNQELADQVGLSPSPCLRRVRRLERDGFIRTYRAVLDRDTVGLGLTVFVEIKVEKHSRDNAQALQQALVSMPEVVACHMVSGTADFMYCRSKKIPNTLTRFGTQRWGGSASLRLKSRSLSPQITSTGASTLCSSTCISPGYLRRAR